MITSSTARTRVRSTSRSDVRMVVERSTASPTSIAGEIEACSCGISRLHPIDRADDVGARLPVEDDQDGRLAVGKAGVAQVFHPVGDLADIGKMYRRAVAVGDDQRLVVGGLVGLVVGIDLIALVADVDAAFRAVGVGAGERGPHVFQANAVFVDRLRDQIDAHRRQRTAADDDLADAFDLRELLRQHGRCRVIDLAARHRVRGQCQDDDRGVRRIDLACRLDWSAGLSAGRLGPR